MKRLMDIAWVALYILGAAVIVMLLIVALWVHDVWDDRNHTVRVKSETPVFAGSGNEKCEGK